MIIGDIYTYMNCKFDLEAYLGKNVDLITDDNIRSGIREYLLDGAIAIR